MTFSREEKLLCLRSAKSRYLSYAFARREMEGMIRALGYENDEGRRMFVYRCNYCQGFHFGSTYERNVREEGSSARYRRLKAAYALRAD